MIYLPGSTFFWNKQGLISVLSIMLCLGVIGISLHLGPLIEKKAIEQAGSTKDSKPQSHFFTVNFFQLNMGEKYHHILARSFFDRPSTSSYFFRFPQGTIFLPQREPIFYEAERGKFVEKTQTLYLEQKVWLRDRVTHMWGDRGLYKLEKSFAHLKGNVRSETLMEKSQDKMRVNATEVLSWPKRNFAYYRGDVHGVLERAKDYQPDIYYQALLMSVDLNKNLIQLFDQVQIKQEQMQANSHKGEIFLDNLTRKVRSYTLYEDVRLVEKLYTGARDVKNSPVFTLRKAFSERLDGYLNDERVILTGMPKVVQDQDVLKGNKITLYSNNEVMEVEESHSSFVLKDMNGNKSSKEPPPPNGKVKKSPERSSEWDEDDDWKK